MITANDFASLTLSFITLHVGASRDVILADGEAWRPVDAKARNLRRVRYGRDV